MSSVNTAIQLITREQATTMAGGAAANTCSPALARGPWDFDLAEALAGVPAYGPAPPPPTSPRRRPRGRGSCRRSTAGQRRRAATRRIRAAKATLGDRVVVLGHFYQRDEVDRSTPTSWATRSSSPTRR